MGLFAIADLHFGFSVKKPMDMFGAHWIGHSEKIIKNWKRMITNEDTVLLSGDISWAMSEKEAEADLEAIQGLPGKKIILEGNHDYWWKSTTKLIRQYPGLLFLKNNSIPYEGAYICGTRGWICPNDTRFDRQAKKIYEREQIRLRLSLDSAMRQGAKEIIVMLHFPPTNDKNEPSAFLDILSAYPVKTVVYGHLHGKENHANGLQGEKNGIQFYLTAADYLDFCPKEIYE